MNLSSIYLNLNWNKRFHSRSYVRVALGRQSRSMLSMQKMISCVCGAIDVLAQNESKL